MKIFVARITVRGYLEPLGELFEIDTENIDKDEFDGEEEEAMLNYVENAGPAVLRAYTCSEQVLGIAHTKEDAKEAAIAEHLKNEREIITWKEVNMINPLEQTWNNFGTIAHIPCKICGDPTPMHGTKLCNNCWEVMTRMAGFLQCQNALDYLKRMMRTYRCAQVYLEELCDSDRGRWVNFSGDNCPVQRGRIKNWNQKFVFVVFKCDNNWDNYMNYTAQACSAKFLTFVGGD